MLLCMKLFIGADHRGFDLKNKLIEYLQELDIRVEDLGNYEYDPLDDYPDYTQKVAQTVLQNPDEYLGIVICGSGIGVSMVANRFRHIRCGLGFRKDQVTHGRENDHMNMLSLASDYLTFEEAKGLVDAFIHTQPKEDEKYNRRIEKMETISTPKDLQQ